MQTDKQIKRSLEFLGLAFLFSGSAGLMYQVAWQRILFASFGVDLISITIIVSAFMLGLGLGALAGGWAGDHWPNHALVIFAVSEAGIGLFGLCSPHFMRSIADILFDATFWLMATANFMLVLIPTFLMGATLPVLITFLAKIWRNVGESTGYLYALNTFGAMLGTFAVGFLLFIYIGLDQVIYLAAFINLSVALLVYYFLNLRLNS
jgi:predicted membrane-bound spermidine synthase